MRAYGKIANERVRNAAARPGEPLRKGLSQQDVIQALAPLGERQVGRPAYERHQIANDALARDKAAPGSLAIGEMRWFVQRQETL